MPNLDTLLTPIIDAILSSNDNEQAARLLRDVDNTHGRPTLDSCLATLKEVLDIQYGQFYASVTFFL